MKRLATRSVTPSGSGRAGYTPEMGDADGSNVAVAEAAAAVRRVIGARIRDPHDREDLVQSTLVKVAAAQERLGAEALEGYAIVTARNVVIDHYRTETSRRRHVHRLVEYTRLDGPEELSLRREETDALATALDRLASADRRILLAHEVDGVSTAELAEQYASTAGGVAVRLARARARLRLEFLLVFRNVELPTEKCRPVLLALSAGENRRQVALHAGEHLVDCNTCARLSAPLIERRRSIAGFLPFVGLRPLLRGTRRALKSGKVQAAVGVTAVAGVVAVAVVAPSTPSTRNSALATPVTAPRPTRPTVTVPVAGSPLMAGATPLLPLPVGGLEPFEGRAVSAWALTVLSVPANEGAWLGTDAENRVWVEFIGPGESPFHVLPGQRLTFVGMLKRNRPDYARSIGLGPGGAGASVLDAMVAHIEVAYSSVHIAPR
jgi:RNA polymerase sigma factor (sigma-70 family)